MKRLWTLVLLPTVVAKNYPQQTHKVHFGASQFVIGIDNRSTTSMCNEPSDFIGKLDPVTVRLKSYDDNKTVKMMKGTLKWNWQDDDGRSYSFKLRNSYYDPNGTILLSPQHWVSEVKANYKAGNVFYKGDDKHISLHW